MIRLVYDRELGECDLAAAEDGGVAEGDELRTAILISLLSDAPADAPIDGDRRGWWGDAYAPLLEQGDRTGSRLWILQRDVVLAETPARAREMALEALRWLVDDGIARAVDVTASKPERGRIDLAVIVTLTDGTQQTYEVPGAL